MTKILEAVEKPRPPYKGVIVRWTDADTVVLDIGLNHRDLGINLMVELVARLYGVNCPERNTPEGKEAIEFVRAQYPDGIVVDVVPVKANDKYGRLLADIRFGGYSISGKLIEAKHGVEYLPLAGEDYT